MLTSRAFDQAASLFNPNFWSPNHTFPQYTPEQTNQEWLKAGVHHHLPKMIRVEQVRQVHLEDLRPLLREVERPP